MTIDNPVSFRPPDPEFCELFNLAMDATGSDVTDLAICAIRYGLIPAVQDMLESRKQAEQRLRSKTDQVKLRTESPKSRPGE